MFQVVREVRHNTICNHRLIRTVILVVVAVSDINTELNCINTDTKGTTSKASTKTDVMEAYCSTGITQSCANRTDLWYCSLLGTGTYCDSSVII